ncbi:RNA-directed DNA polymerase, eukaryota, partial [Tanacetum coccineum]
MFFSFRRDPRGGAEASQLGNLTSQLEGVTLGISSDRWVWSLVGTGEFSVASVRKLIDDIRLPEVSSQSRWIKEVPIKVNVLSWKVRLDGLPTRLNISRRGIDIPSILCPICDREVESVSHLFFKCHVATDIFKKICRWWNVDFVDIKSYDDWFSWLLNLNLRDIPLKEKIFDDNLVETSMFKGVALDSSTIISHMFYADDAVFVGQWDNSNIKTVTYALKCFEKASGLRINMGKSKIMGIAVNDEKVNQVAHRIGCGILKVPFTYIGSKVGGCMSGSQAWSDVIAKMNARLSKWKMKILSIG